MPFVVVVFIPLHNRGCRISKSNDLFFIYNVVFLFLFAVFFCFFFFFGFITLPITYQEHLEYNSNNDSKNRSNRSGRNSSSNNSNLCDNNLSTNQKQQRQPTTIEANLKHFEFNSQLNPMNVIMISYTHVKQIVYWGGPISYRYKN